MLHIRGNRRGAGNSGTAQTVGLAGPAGTEYRAGLLRYDGPRPEAESAGCPGSEAQCHGPARGGDEGLV
eukprot:444454-Hanusia_phi.AAC.1